MKRAVYDLATMPTTFDFAVYAVAAKTLGYEEIRFVAKRVATWKYEEVVAWRRFANIVLPLCTVARMPFSVCSALHVEGDILEYGTGFIESVYRQTGRIEKLRSTGKTDRAGYVTITKRRSFRNAWRNSNEEAWRRIKDWLKAKGERVVVLDECEADPMDVDERLAIYEAAKMNLAVGNGTGVLCWLSDAPYLHFMLPNPPGSEDAVAELREQWIRLGFPVGSQLSFRTKRQRIVWGPDDFETISDAWAQMFEGEA